MDKTLINIKIDKSLKHEAQKAARDIGLPLGTILNAYLRDFVREKRVVFSVPPQPNQKVRETLKKIEADIRKRKNAHGPFTHQEAMAYLSGL